MRRQKAMTAPRACDLCALTAYVAEPILYAARTRRTDIRAPALTHGKRVAKLGARSEIGNHKGRANCMRQSGQSNEASDIRQAALNNHALVVYVAFGRDECVAVSRSFDNDADMIESGVAVEPLEADDIAALESSVVGC